MDTVAPWIQAREVANDTLPEFHWRHKIVMYENLRDALGYTSTWSIFDVERFYDIAFDGVIAGLHYDPHNGMDVTIPLNVTNPTWFDIWWACEQAIVESRKKGNHHNYIEEVKQQGTSLYLFTGS